MGKKRLFILGFIVVLLTAIPLTVYFIKFQTSQNIKAAPSTTLSFTPPTQAVGVGQTFNTDITIDPGTNQVSVVKLNLSYDSSKVATAAPGLVANSNAFPQTLDPVTYGPCNGTTCTITMTVAIGIDTTKAVTTKTTVATLTLKALAVTPDQNPTNVTFGSSTTVFSIAQTDQGSENVLSATNPLAVTITAGPPTSPTPIGGGGNPTPTSGPGTGTTVPTPTQSIIAQNQPPACTSLSVDQNTATPGGTLNFTANGNSPSGTIAKVTFNFGDGSVQDVTNGGGIGTNSVSVQLAHTFIAAGTYTATAIMTDNTNTLSNATSCSQTVTIGTSGSSASQSATPATPFPTATIITKLPKTGPGDIFFLIGGAGVVLTIIGGFIFFAL